ncbi:flagella basal body P-ring formation protein FlgA [Rhodobacterales bacterium 52_120_T64]|nr:flagella basal body P-ring formation protein FlgA [Rhodobacterales bacterium 52_120_T64]
MKLVFLSIFLLLTSVLAVSAQTVVAAHGIRARSIIMPEDLAILDKDTIGGIADATDIIGQEARVNLYAGRAIRVSEIGEPAILERNQLVFMTYSTGLLTISTEGRVLNRVGIGEMARVMNLASRLTVTGRVLFDGTIEVGG